MDKDQKTLVLNIFQYYLDSAQQFLTYDEMEKLKSKLEKICIAVGITSWD